MGLLQWLFRKPAAKAAPSAFTASQQPIVTAAPTLVASVSPAEIEAKYKRLRAEAMKSAKTPQEASQALLRLSKEETEAMQPIYAARDAQKNETATHEIAAWLSLPRDAQLSALMTFRSQQTAYGFADRLGLVAQTHNDEQGFQLLVIAYRNERDSKVTQRLSHILLSFDLSLLNAEFDARAIAEMSLAAWEYGGFDPNTGRFSVQNTSNMRDGWNAVTSELYGDLSEAVLKDRFDWANPAIEGLLLGMGARALPLVLSRLNSRPTRMQLNVAKPHWGTAIKVLGKIGQPEHVKYLDDLADAVGSANPDLANACQSAASSIRER